MTTTTDYDNMLREAATRRLLRQEELILEVIEALAQALERSGVSQAVLAQRLGKSKAFVSQILGGGRNLTLRTVADVADALGSRVVVKTCRVERRSLTPERCILAWAREQQQDRAWARGPEPFGDFQREAHGDLQSANDNRGVAV
jgi:transcriptional regulator with XRE-family HTH domain